MRYALPIYSDTDADPDLYDFEDSDYSIVNLWGNIEGAEFFKVTAGQKLENGLTVSKAFCTVPAVFDDGAHIRVNEIYLEGSITAEGVLEYYGQDEYILPEGSVLFYPDPLSCGNLPVSYDDTLCTAGSVDINGEFAFRNDGARFYVGNINEIDTDISDYFEHKTLVKVKATLSDIILRYDENTGGNVSSAVLKEVELQDKSNFNNTNSVSTETAPSEEAAAQSRGENETKLYHALEDAEIDTKKIKQLTGEELKSVDFTDCTIAVLDNYGVKIYERLSDEKAKEFTDCIIQAEINSDEYGELPEKNGGTTYEFQITLNTNEQIYVGTLRAEDNDLIVINGNHGYPCDEKTSDQIRECYQEIYKRFAEKAWQQ